MANGTANGVQFTPIQRRMMAILEDNQPHNRHELVPCLNDELGPVTNVHAHIFALRKKLAPDRGILIEYIRSSLHYRLVWLKQPS